MVDDPIKHIVVLMFENRSFDHILAGIKKMRDCYDLGGINKYGRQTYRQEPGPSTDHVTDRKSPPAAALALNS